MLSRLNEGVVEPDGWLARMGNLRPLKCQAKLFWLDRSIEPSNEPAESGFELQKSAYFILCLVPVPRTGLPPVWVRLHYGM